MEVIGGLKWGLDLMGKLTSWWAVSRDPARKQAIRMLEATIAHGVSPLQLPRLLPEHLMLQAKDLSSANSLANKVSIHLVDWFVSEFSLSAEWLEVGKGKKHQTFDWYKRPGHLFRWLQERGSGQDGRIRELHLISEAPFEHPATATGRFLLVYEEAFADLGASQSVSRYWLMSEGYRFEHEPCVLDLFAAMTIAESFGIGTRGHGIRQKILKSAEEGELKPFLPSLIEKAEGWRLDDWVPRQYLVENCRGEWHSQLWTKTLDLLDREDLRVRLNLDRFSRK